jgi:hypothetical protein
VAHNTLATVTNGGSKATAARLTLHYDDGRQKYEMQQTIQPGGQMWVNFADLIHNRTPDRQGNLLPADLASATYDVQDLSPGLGSLAPASLAVDNTLGSQVNPDYPDCCGAVYPGWDPDAFVLEVDGIDVDNAMIKASNSCTDQTVDISGDFTDWFSANPAVALVTTKLVQAVSPGATTGSAKGAVLEGGGAVCVLRVVQVNAAVRVHPALSLSTPLWFFGSGINPPATFTLGNTYSTVTANGASGGSFSWTITNGAGLVSFASGSQSSSTTTGGNTVIIYSIGYSTSANDVTIELSWTPSGGSVVNSTLSLDVDSPYQLTLVSTSGPTGVITCPPATGSNPIGWWVKYTWNMVSFFGQNMAGISINENFDNEINYQTNNWGDFVPNGSAGVSGVSTFSDNYCFANQTAAKPPTTPPQNPLTASPVDSATQSYNVGSNIVGDGFLVQSQTLSRYVDHATVTNIQGR